MASSRKTWVSVLIASVIIIGILAVAIVGGTAFFIYRHIDARITPIESAEQQFTAARARFKGQTPLIEMRAEQPVVHRPAPGPRHDLKTLHALAYDARAQKLVHIRVPVWLLRFMPTDNSIHLSDLDDFDVDFDSRRTRLTLEDLERHGPGLVLDLTKHRYNQVLVWTE